ncbi:hypothetical protein ACMBCM_10125, partial [Spiroplasma sp. K1]
FFFVYNFLNVTLIFIIILIFIVQSNIIIILLLLLLLLLCFRWISLLFLFLLPFSQTKDSFQPQR